MDTNMRECFFYPKAKKEKKAGKASLTISSRKRCARWKIDGGQFLKYSYYSYTKQLNCLSYDTYLCDEKLGPIVESRIIEAASGLRWLTLAFRGR